MHVQGICLWCEQRVLGAHWQLFEHWEEARREIMAIEGHARARRYGLAFRPWWR
jgi:hypothetical protein